MLSNALKYAFRDGRSGRIDIVMRCEPGVCQLVVRDDGIGMQGKSPRDGSLGMSLVRSLVQSIDGTLHTAEDHGVVHTIRFPHSGAKPDGSASGTPSPGAFRDGSSDFRKSASIEAAAAHA